MWANSKALKWTFLMFFTLWTPEAQSGTTARTAVKLCGRKLSEIMSKVCYAFNNSPSWDDPPVVEPRPTVRRKRHLGIADECCTLGCTWKQLNEYCAVSAYSESPLEMLEAHAIADRSAEESNKARVEEAALTPAVAARGGGGGQHEVGGGRRTRGYGRSRARGRRCWCRRKRRTGRRRSSLMEPNKKCRSRCSRRRHRVPSAHVGSDPQH